MVLRREDVARDPADVGAEVGQRLDEHRGLNRHVQAAHDAGAGERLAALVAGADGHQPGHLVLGEADFLAAPFGEREVGNLIRLALSRFAASNACISFTAVVIDLVPRFVFLVLSPVRRALCFVGALGGLWASCFGRWASCFVLCGLFVASYRVCFLFFGSRVVTSRGDGDEQGRPLASGSSGSGWTRTSEPGGGHQLARLLLGKTEPDVSHLLLILRTIVREHVDDQHAAAAMQDASGLLQGPPRIGQVMQHERHQDDVHLTIVDGQRFESAEAQIDVRLAVEAAPRFVQHVGGAVDADDLAERAERRGGELPGAAAEIGDAPGGVQETEQRMQVKRAAEQVSAQVIPLPRRGRGKLGGLRAPALEDARQPAFVLIGGAGRRHLLADQRPQPPRAGIELVDREAVIAAGTVASRDHPTGVSERLQMPTHGRLRQLQNRAHLRNRELMAFEQEQQSASQRVGERRHVVEHRPQRLHARRRPLVDFIRASG